MTWIEHHSATFLFLIFVILAAGLIWFVSRLTWLYKPVKQYFKAKGKQWHTIDTIFTFATLMIAILWTMYVLCFFDGWIYGLHHQQMRLGLDDLFWHHRDFFLIVFILFTIFGGSWYVSDSLGSISPSNSPSRQKAKHGMS